MSRFSGPQKPGATKEHQQRKRDEAGQRGAFWAAIETGNLPQAEAHAPLYAGNAHAQNMLAALRSKNQRTAQQDQRARESVEQAGELRVVRDRA